MSRSLRSGGIALLDASARHGESTQRTCVFRANGITSIVQWTSKARQWISCSDRILGVAVAQAFVRKALATNATRWPKKVTLDGHVLSHCAVRLLRRENAKWKFVEVRSSKYLNNIVEQDHRAIKRRCASMTDFKSCANASITVSGIALARRIENQQNSFGRGRRPRKWSLKQHWERALA
jgi:hypothetical protein